MEPFDLVLPTDITPCAGAERLLPAALAAAADAGHDVLFTDVELLDPRAIGAFYRLHRGAVGGLEVVGLARTAFRAGGHVVLAGARAKVAAALAEGPLEALVARGRLAGAVTLPFLTTPGPGPDPGQALRALLALDADVAAIMAALPPAPDPLDGLVGALLATMASRDFAVH